MFQGLETLLNLMGAGSLPKLLLVLLKGLFG